MVVITVVTANILGLNSTPASPVKAVGKNIAFHRFLAACRRLYMPHGLEIRLHEVQHTSLRPAAETFGDEETILDQHLDGEIQRGLEKRRRTKMVRRAVARCRRCHIAQHPMSATTDLSLIHI